MRKLRIAIAALALTPMLGVSPASAAAQNQNYVGNADAVGYCPGVISEVSGAGVGLACFPRVTGSVSIEVIDDQFGKASYYVQWLLPEVDPITGSQKSGNAVGCGKKTFSIPGNATALNVFVDGPVSRATNGACLADPVGTATVGIGTSGTVKITY